MHRVPITMQEMMAYSYHFCSGVASSIGAEKFCWQWIATQGV